MPRAPANPSPIRIGATATTGAADGAKVRPSRGGLLRHATVQLAAGIVFVLFAAAVSILLLVEL